MESGQSVTWLVLAHKEDRMITYKVFPWKPKQKTKTKKPVLCFIENPVTNMF